MPTVELVHVWSSLRAGSVRVFDVRTYLACREVAEQRKFASRGVVPVYRLEELDDLVGGGGERQLRASLRRLARAGILSWRGTKGPRFHNSPDSLAVEALPLVQEMQAQMPARRAFFPMPRPMLRLLAGGVKRSVLATVFAHLLRCPHLKAGVWDPSGMCSASWVSEAFGLSVSSVRAARAHLIHELGWLVSEHEDQQQWHKNRFGGRFAINLAWTAQTPGEVAQQARAVELSTAESGPPNPRFGPESGGPESDQPSPSEIHQSDLSRAKAPEGPQADFFKQAEGQGKPEAADAPRLRDIKRCDLTDVGRVMELFEQALVCPQWSKRGWTPKEDSHLERLNWAAAARRAHVRGSTNPCGVFVHLVSQRKWEHVSNEDEDAVRGAFSRWVTPVLPAGVEETRAGMPELRSALSADGAVIRRIENALRERAPQTSRAEVDGYLKSQAGWGSERIEAARASFQAWRRSREECC